jgi:hypothetical protein
MHKNATKYNKTQSKWCINKHGASKIIDMFETYQGANLCWSGVEAQGTPNTTAAHHNLLEPSHKDGRPDHYGTLEGDHRTRTKLGAISTTQLEAPKKLPLRHHKAWEDLHNLIGGPQEIDTEAPQSLERSPQLNWRSPRNPLIH